MLRDVAHVGLYMCQDLNICVSVDGGILGSLVTVDGHTHLADAAVCHEACPDKGCDVGLVLGDGIALIYSVSR